MYNTSQKVNESQNSIVNHVKDVSPQRTVCQVSLEYQCRYANQENTEYQPSGVSHIDDEPHISVANQYTDEPQIKVVNQYVPVSHAADVNH